MSKLGLASTIALIGAMATSVQAGPILMLGNNPQPNEENILYGTNQTGTTVFGSTNQSHTKIDFSSTTDVLLTPAVGQADLTAQDGFINDLTINVDGGTTFHDLIIDPQGAACLSLTAPVPCRGNNSTGSVITVNASDGSFTFNETIGNGNNFFTIIAATGELLDSVTIDSNQEIVALGFEDLKQPRISGITGVVDLPEPSSLLIYGIGILGIVGFVRGARGGKYRLYRDA